MSFAANEVSVDSGRPLELLMVSFLTNHWYFTTAEVAVVHDGHTYAPMPFSHSKIAPTGDVSKSSITIQVPQDCPIGDLFRAQSPSGIVTATLFEKHVDDAEVKVIWKGRLLNASWEQPWLSLTSESVFSSLKRLGIRRRFSVQCPHVLYSQGLGMCNVNREDFREDYEVTAISGTTITCSGAAAKPSGYFSGGYATWINAITGSLEQRMIESSDGADLIITSPPPGLIVGASVTTYPGCDHQPETCDGKFDNKLNNGGMEFTPKKNPFNGSTLY